MENLYKNNSLVLTPFELRKMNIVFNKAFFQKHYNFFKERELNFNKSMLNRAKSEKDKQLIKALYLKEILKTLETNEEVLQVYVRSQKTEQLNSDVRFIQEQVNKVGEAYIVWEKEKKGNQQINEIEFTESQLKILKETKEFQDIWQSQHDKIEEKVIIHASLLNLFMGQRDGAYLKTNIIAPYTRVEIDLKQKRINQYRGETYAVGFEKDEFEPWEYTISEELIKTENLKDIKKQWLLEDLELNLNGEEKEDIENFSDKEEDVQSVNSIFIEKYLLFNIAFLLEEKMIIKREFSRKKIVQNASKKKKKRKQIVKKYCYLTVNEEKVKRIVSNKKEERQKKEKSQVK